MCGIGLLKSTRNTSSKKVIFKALLDSDSHAIYTFQIFKG